MHSEKTVSLGVERSRTQNVDDIVILRDLTRELPLGNENIQILRGVSFSIPRRAWIAIMGPSGSGKST